VLQYHDRHVNNHKSKSNKVHYSEYANHQILVGNCGYKEGSKKSKLFLYVSSSHGEVNMSHEETVNGEVPLAPVLREIPCVPPVTVEPSIREHSKLCPHVHVAVEEGVEASKPHIGCGYTYLKGQNKHQEVVLVS
jgi:hypothetical protein